MSHNPDNAHRYRLAWLSARRRATLAGFGYTREDTEAARREAQAEIAAMLEDRASTRAMRGTEAGRVLLGMAETIRRMSDIPARDRPVHEPFTDDGVTYCGWHVGNGVVIDGCGEVWPCSTVSSEYDRYMSTPEGER